MTTIDEALTERRLIAAVDAATLRADRAEEALERAMKVVEAAKEWDGDDCECPVPGEIIEDDAGHREVHFTDCGECRVCKLCAAVDALDADQEEAK